MARAAVVSMSEIERERRLDELQETLAWLGMIPGVGIVFDITNIAISLARGNYKDAALYTIFALPYIGTVAGVALLGYAYGQSLIADPHGAASGAEDETTELPIRYRVSWVSGRGGSNSFAAATGVVTGVDENGNPMTTNIEDLEVGDVVLSGNELDPSDPNHYALVTEVHSRTVYEQTEITYIDDVGNIEVLKTTGNHEFYVEGTGWVTAAELQQGNLLTLSDGRGAIVTNRTTIAFPEGLTVYNLSISDGSTFFVDDGQGNVSAVWVHNFFKRVSRVQKEFRRKLGLKRGDKLQAGHVVPLAFWVTRSVQTIRSVLQAKIVLARVKIPLNGKVNGFKAKVGGHNGTHTDAFFQAIGPRLKKAYNRAKAQGKSFGEVRAAVVREMDRIKIDIDAGKWIPKK